MAQERPLQQCTRWFDMLTTHFPELSRAQLRTLALWSYAATLTQPIASTTCAAFLARLFERPYDAFLQRLREFYRPAHVKRGACRCTLQVHVCFAPLLRWTISLPQSRELVLALDATLCRDRLAVLSLSVVFRGSALPVAWKVLPANQEEAWLPQCMALLTHLRDAVPETMPVIVLCDRGLMSTALFEAIGAQGWHPMMRLTRCGKWRPEQQAIWYALSNLLPAPGHYYIGRGHLFKTKPLFCTLVAIWEEGQQEPWLLMTDLPPQRCCGRFYGLRMWIEQGFRVMKSGGYRCEHLRVVEPARAERIWLVMVVSQLWTHTVGGLRAACECGLSRLLCDGSVRALGVHRTGWIELLVAAIRGEAMPLPVRLIAARLPGPATGIRIQLIPDRLIHSALIASTRYRYPTSETMSSFV